MTPIYDEDFIPQHAQTWIRLNTADGLEVPAGGGYERAPIIYYETESGMYPLFDVHFPRATKTWADGQTIAAGDVCSTPSVGNILDIVCQLNITFGNAAVPEGSFVHFLIENYSTKLLDQTMPDVRPALQPYATLLRGTPLAFTQGFRDMHVRWRHVSREVCLMYGYEKIVYYASVYMLSADWLIIDEQIQPAPGTQDIIARCLLTLDRKFGVKTGVQVSRSYVPGIEARISARWWALDMKPMESQLKVG